MKNPGFVNNCFPFCLFSNIYVCNVTGWCIFRLFSAILRPYVDQKILWKTVRVGATDGCFTGVRIVLEANPLHKLHPKNHLHLWLRTWVLNYCTFLIDMLSGSATITSGLASRDRRLLCGCVSSIMEKIHRMLGPSLRGTHVIISACFSLSNYRTKTWRLKYSAECIGGDGSRISRGRGGANHKGNFSWKTAWKWRKLNKERRSCAAQNGRSPCREVELHLPGWRRRWRRRWVWCWRCWGRCMSSGRSSPYRAGGSHPTNNHMAFKAVFSWAKANA